jgi:hypothetical protein
MRKIYIVDATMMPFVSRRFYFFPAKCWRHHLDGASETGYEERVCCCTRELWVSVLEPATLADKRSEVSGFFNKI